MASQTFDLTGAGASSSSSLVLATDGVRVRFSRYEGEPNVFVGITANAVTSYMPISRASDPENYMDEVDDRAHFVAPVIAGDTVFLYMVGNGSGDRVTGILETL